MKFYTTFQIIYNNEHIASNVEAMLPSPEEYRKAIKKLIKAKKTGAPIVSSLRYFKRLLRWEDYSKTYRIEKKKGDIPCWAGKLFCTIDTDGTVYPCVGLIEKIKGLNFLEVGFEKAFDDMSFVKCSSCTVSCAIDFNLMFSLYPDVIYNWMKYVYRSRRLTK